MSSLLSLFCHPLFISIFAVFEVVNSETLLQLECPCPVKLNGIVIFMESPSHFQRFFALRIDKSTSVDLQSTSSDDQQQQPTSLGRVPQSIQEEDEEESEEYSSTTASKQEAAKSTDDSYRVYTFLPEIPLILLLVYSLPPPPRPLTRGELLSQRLEPMTGLLLLII